MKRTFISLLRRYRNLVLYGVIGAMASSIDFCVYSTMILIGVNLLIANAIGVNVGIITSFCLNRRYNFKVKDHAKMRFASFYLIGMIGLAISTGMLYVAVDKLCINEFYSKLLTIVLVALIQFMLNKAITFRTNHSCKAN